MRLILLAVLIFIGIGTYGHADDAVRQAQAVVDAAKARAAAAYQEVLTAQARVLDAQKREVQAQQAAPTSTPATEATQPAAVTSAPTPTPASTVVAISSEVRDAVLSLAAALITAMVGVILTWLRGHLRIMQDATMNAQVTASAQAFGGLLIKTLQDRGASITSIDVGDPDVKRFADAVMSNYPTYAARLGFTPDKVGGVMIKAAANKEVDAALPAGPIAEPIQPPSPPAWPAGGAIPVKGP